MRKWSPLLVSFIILFTSCLSELDKYYEVPDWLKGDAWKVMESKGNFKLFMSAIERSAYKELVQGKGIITVMAPTDSAFQAYLTKHNYASVEAIPQTDLDQLIGYHVMQYSYSKDALMNYKPGGAESENSIEGMYFKFRTYSRAPITTETDEVLNKSYKVIHTDRLLPVFSYKLFAGNKIDAKSNYEFLYPGSKWTGDSGFNVSDASVLEYTRATDNGFVYTIDKVIEPLPTIGQSLTNDPDYSYFINNYERFKTYIYDAAASNNYGEGDSLFVKRYTGDLPPISSEWINTTFDASTTSHLSFNVLAPKNAALQAFFSKYWAPYYRTLSDVRFEPLLAVLQNHINYGSFAFPEQLQSGEFRSNLGNYLTVDQTKIDKRQVCVNGSLYGLTEVIVPPMFTKVTAPMYKDPKYTMFLDMAINGSIISTLISNAVNFKVFYPTDSMFIKNTYVEGSRLYYFDEYAAKYGFQYVKIDGDGGPTPMSSSMKRSLAGSHIATELITSKGNEYIYRTLTSFSYLYIKGDKVYSSGLYNQAVNYGSDKAPTFVKLTGDWDNGDVYELSDANDASALVPESNQFKFFIPDGPATPSDMNTFVKLAGLAGMHQTTPIYDFLMGERFILFLPPSDQLVSFCVAKGYIEDNSGTLTVLNKSGLLSYLKSYFVNVNSSKLLDYPFPGARIEGDVTTFAKQSDGITPVALKLTDNSSYIGIKDPKGNSLKVTGFFPRIYADGAVYLIDKPLNVE